MVNLPTFATGMNAAVRATVRVGLYTGAKVFFVHEVNNTFGFFSDRFSKIKKIQLTARMCFNELLQYYFHIAIVDRVTKV